MIPNHPTKEEKKKECKHHFVEVSKHYTSGWYYGTKIIIYCENCGKVTYSEDL